MLCEGTSPIDFAMRFMSRHGACIAGACSLVCNACKVLTPVLLALSSCCAWNDLWLKEAFDVDLVTIWQVSECNVLVVE